MDLLSTPLRLSLMGLLCTLVACGGSGDNPAAASSGGSGGSSGASSGVESSLSVTFEGETYQSKSPVKESGVKFGDRMDALLIADSYKDPSGRPELSMTIITPIRKEGTYEIVSNQNKIARAESDDIAVVTFQVGSLDKLMKVGSGTLTVETLETPSQGTSYTIKRLKGSFDGTFRGAKGVDFPVQGTFDYAK